MFGTAKAVAILWLAGSFLDPAARRVRDRFGFGVGRLLREGKLLKFLLLLGRDSTLSPLLIIDWS